MIHEMARQLPTGVKPDAIICSVGGAGLLGGILRGVNDVGWDQSTNFYRVKDSNITTLTEIHYFVIIFQPKSLRWRQLDPIAIICPFSLTRRTRQFEH